MPSLSTSNPRDVASVAPTSTALCIGCRRDGRAWKPRKTSGGWQSSWMPLNKPRQWIGGMRGVELWRNSIVSASQARSSRRWRKFERN